MNGFRKIIYVLIVLFNNSCIEKNIKSLDGEALFITYKFIPKNENKKLEIWASPKQFIDQNYQMISNSFQQYFLLNLEKPYLLLRYGRRLSQQDSFISNIEFFNKGASMIVCLLPTTIENKRASDRGYVILVPNNGIRNIIFKQDKKTIFMTNYTIK